MARTQAEMEITADVRGIRAAGQAIKDVFTLGASESTKMKREIANVDRAVADLAKTQRRLNLELKGVKVGSDGYKEMRVQIEAADRAMRSLRSEASKMRDTQRTADSNKTESEARRHRIESGVRAFSSALTGLAGQSPLQPYSAMAGGLQAGAAGFASMPYVGTAASVVLGLGAAGMQIKQQRMDRYMQWRSAFSHSAPHIDPSLHGSGAGQAYGMSPEQAMGIAAATTSATGGQYMGGGRAVDMSTRGFGPGAAAIGALFAPGGMARLAGSMTNEGRGDIIRRVQNTATGMVNGSVAMFGGTANPQLVEKTLERIATATQEMADKGIDADPLKVAGMLSAFTRAGFRASGQAGISSQVFAGHRGAALGSALNGMVGGDGAGGIMGLLSTGFGSAGGPGLADALAMQQNGIGPGADQINPARLAATMQAMLGRGGPERDLMDVVMAKELGLTHQQMTAMRRVDPADMMGGPATGDVKQFEAYHARPDWVNKLDSKTIESGRAAAESPGAAAFSDLIFQSQDRLVAFADGIMVATDAALKWAEAVKKKFDSTGASIPAIPGGGR